MCVNSICFKLGRNYLKENTDGSYTVALKTLYSTEIAKKKNSEHVYHSYNTVMDNLHENYSTYTVFWLSRCNIVKI